SSHYLYHVISFSHNSVLFAPHSFPTRRSSDLGISVWSFLCVLANCVLIFAVCNGKSNVIKDFALFTKSFITYPFFKNKTNRGKRSEEHTSELQSRENLVCRLLLEKKKTEHKER